MRRSAFVRLVAPRPAQLPARRAGVAALLCALFVFLLIGHALHVARMDDGEEMGMGTAAVICLILFTLAAPLALALPAGFTRRALVAVVVPRRAITLPRLDARVPSARASPAWLQRFLD